MVFNCGCDPRVGTICSAHCQWQGCRGRRHTDWCIRGERVNGAKDLPEGSEVQALYTTWVKARPGHNECWTNNGNPDAHISDGAVDRLLGNGGWITLVPAERGRWLRQEREARRG